jgi:hypothetical protein
MLIISDYGFRAETERIHIVNGQILLHKYAQRINVNTFFIQVHNTRNNGQAEYTITGQARGDHEEPRRLED